MKQFNWSLQNKTHHQNKIYTPVLL